MSYKDDFQNILPTEVLDWIDTQNNKTITELVLHVGMVPLVRFERTQYETLDYIVTEETISAIEKLLPKFNSKNRTSLNGHLHRISKIVNVDRFTIGFTIRFGKIVPNVADRIADIIGTNKSVLIIAPPGRGKTTMLRDIARHLSKKLDEWVVVVDHTNELAGNGDIPHECIGDSLRLQVPAGKAMAEVMIEAVENHNPDTIIVDELSDKKDAFVAKSIANRGVKLIATVHGRSLKDVVDNPDMKLLIGNVSTSSISDDNAEKNDGRKTRIEREYDPVFDYAIEILSFDRYVVYTNVSEAVDAILQKDTKDMSKYASLRVCSGAEFKTTSL